MTFFLFDFQSFVFMNLQNLTNQMAGISLNNDFKAPTVPAVTQINSQMNPLMSSRQIPSNNSMPPSAGVSPMPTQNGAPQTTNGRSQPFNGPNNQFVTQVKTRFSHEDVRI